MIGSKICPARGIATKNHFIAIDVFNHYSFCAQPAVAPAL